MPSNVVKSIAKKADKGVSEVEDLWDRAKQEVNDQYDDIDQDSDRYWKLVTSITKKMAGLKESAQEDDDMEGGLEGKVRRTPSGEEIEEYKKKKKDGESYEEESDDSGNANESVVESFQDVLDQEYDRL